MTEKPEWSDRIESGLAGARPPTPNAAWTVEIVRFGIFKRRRFELKQGRSLQLSVERWGPLSQYWFVTTYTRKHEYLDGVFLKRSSNMRDFLARYIKAHQ